MTCHAYLPWLRAFSMPVVAPVRDLISIALHPQDWVSPVLRLCRRTDVSLPQSHRHIQCVPALGDSSKYSAVNLPNFFPVISSLRLTFCLQPQDALGLLSSRPVSLMTVLPQAHRHTHAKAPRSLWVRSTTVKNPNCIPTKSSEPNLTCRSLRRFSVNLPNDSRRKHPQDTAFPLSRYALTTSFSFPQAQRHNQTAPRVSLCEYDKTVSLPNTLPAKSMILLRPVPIVGVPTGIPIVTPNNNAASASHVMLSRQHVMHRRRGYQYNTCVCCLDKSHYSTGEKI